MTNQLSELSCNFCLRTGNFHDGWCCNCWLRPWTTLGRGGRGPYRKIISPTSRDLNIRDDVFFFVFFYIFYLDVLFLWKQCVSMFPYIIFLIPALVTVTLYLTLHVLPGQKVHTCSKYNLEIDIGWIMTRSEYNWFLKLCFARSNTYHTIRLIIS